MRPSDETGGDNEKETIRGDRWGYRDNERRQVRTMRPSDETGGDNEKATIR
jgi:hypothetical protein